jgi:putative Holliday junction resolvase
VRVVGLDLGTRRVGVAVSDAGGVLASPHAVLTRSGDARLDRRAIADVVRAVAADRVVVGLPLSLNGTMGPAAEAASAEAAALAELLDVPVELRDERLTTVSAVRALAEARSATAEAAGRSPGRPRRRHPPRRNVDAEAAAIMLQAWLDTPRPPA